MKKLRMQTMNIVDDNIKKIGELFPKQATRFGDKGKKFGENS